MKNVFKMLKYILSYRILLGTVVGFNLLAVVFSMCSLVMVIPFLDLLFGKAAIIHDYPGFVLSSSGVQVFLKYYLSQIILNYGKTDALIFICVLVVVSFFFKNLNRYLGLFYIDAIRNNIVLDIRNNLYHRILILPLSYFTENKKGDVMSRISNDVQEVEWSIMSSLVMIFRDPISIVAYLIILISISPSLTIIVLVLLPATSFLINRIGKSLKEKSLAVQQRMGLIVSVIEETIAGLRIIKAFNAIDHSNYKFKKINKNYTGRMIGVYRRRDLAAPLSEMLSVLAIVIILMIGSALVIGGKSTLEADLFIAYILVFSQIIPPMQSCTSAYYNILKGSASATRIQEILDAKEVIIEKPDAKPIGEFKQSIEFRNVSFAYEKETVLNHVNYTIPKGKTIAIVGASGAGKSTMADLIARFYDTTGGEILIDGIPIKDLVIPDVRALIGYVPQEPILFNDSVYNNICLGIEEKVDISKVIEAAKAANAHEFITVLEHGYDTEIGDRGCKLSGGQKQRICIARALLKKPPLLVFDEATSAQDSESEMLIQQSMQAVMKNRTVIVIAHKLATVQYADEIVVVDKGEIVETGRHEDLITSKGIYQRLYELQTFI